MKFTANQIAQFINGEVIGDENIVVDNFSKIEESKQGDLTFLANPKYLHYIYGCNASVIIINKDFTLEKDTPATLIKVDNAYQAISKLLQLRESYLQKPKGISTLSYISESSSIGKDCYIGEFVSIADNCVIGDSCLIYPNVTIGENVKIGNNCIVYPNVTIYNDCIIGNHVILHGGAVIGADGFGFAPNENGYEKIPQIGNVIVEDCVEIGANTCIDRATMGSTRVLKGVKLDNLVQIAHNTEIGEHTVMSAQVGIAGSTKIGKWCMFGGQVGVAGHITVGDKVFLGAQSGVPGSLKDNQTLMGTPPMGQTAFFRSHAIIKKLPELYQEINQLKKDIQEIKNNKQ